MIYLLTFFSSALFFYLAENIRRKSIRSILAIIGILIPCVIAGCRDGTIGTDVMVYVVPVFDVAGRTDDIVLYAAYLFLQSLVEPLFYWMVYLIAQCTDNYHWVLFAIQVLMTVPAYFAFKKYQKLFGIPVWLAMLLWQLALFNGGLNVMRQGIAASFMFLAVAYMIEGRYRFFFSYILVAVGFHTTAVLGLGLLPMYLLIRQDTASTSYLRARQLIILALLLVVMVIASLLLVEMLIDTGVIKAGYSEYFSGGAYGSSKFTTYTTVIYLMYVIITLAHYPFLIRQRTEWLFFTVLSFIIWIGQFGTLVNAYIGRIVWYLYPLQILSLCIVGRCYRGSYRHVYTVLLTLLVLGFWFTRFVYVGIHSTYPYIFNPAE